MSISDMKVSTMMETSKAQLQGAEGITDRIRQTTYEHQNHGRTRSLASVLSRVRSRHHVRVLGN